MKVAVLAVVLALAGCVQSGSESTDSIGPGIPDSIPVGLRDVAGSCEGTCSIFLGLDERDLRDTVGFTFLDIRVFWDGTAVPGFQLESGNHTPWRGFDSVRLRIANPEPGLHPLNVTGVGDYTLSSWIGDHSVPDGDWLPNLVTLQPSHISISDCNPDETVEQQALRCLRVGNAVANLGHGPLEVHLDYTNAALSPGALGHFQQRIYSSDGVRDVPAGGADFHAVHGHFHYAGLAHFELYEVNDGLRGEQVAFGDKRGFCFLDWGYLNSPEVPALPEHHAEQNCLIPNPAEGWSMGVTVGFYDYYWPELSDQYVEITGIPDGTYELVAIADGANTLRETDETDNIGSALIEISGNTATTLESRAFYGNPEG